MEGTWKKQSSSKSRVLIAFVIFVLLSTISAALLLLYLAGLPIRVSATTRAVYDYIENTLPTGSTVLIDLYYKMAARVELEPQVAAVVKHLFEKNCKLVFVSTIIDGPKVFEMLESTASDVFANKEYGKDYVFLGYVAGNEHAVASLASSIRGTVATDNYGNSITDYNKLPMMTNIDKAEDFKLVFVVSSRTETFGWYIRQWHTAHNIPLLFGTSSVIGPSIKPYVDAKQAIGMLTGRRSAAEYEILVGRRA